MIQPKSQDFRTYTVQKRGGDRDVRVPQFAKELIGQNLLNAIGAAAQARVEDPNRIAPLMKEWITADFKLRERVIVPMLDLAIRQIADARIMATHSKTRAAVSTPSAMLKAGLKAAKESVMKHQIRVGDGKWVALGDCTKEQLLEAASLREKSAATIAADADWFRRISKQLQPKQKVKDALVEADVERFRDQAHKDVA